MEFLAVCILLFIILFIYVQNRDNKQSDDSSFAEIPKNTPENSESFRTKGKIDLMENSRIITQFCRKCGAKIPGDSVYCLKCGEKIIDISEEDVNSPSRPVEKKVSPDSTKAETQHSVSPYTTSLTEEDLENYAAEKGLTADSAFQVINRKREEAGLPLLKDPRKSSLNVLPVQSPVSNDDPSIPSPKTDKPQMGIVKKFFKSILIILVLWGIARLVPAVVSAFFYGNVWVKFIALFITLPLGWLIACPISKGALSSCIRTNLYIFVVIEGSGLFNVFGSLLAGADAYYYRATSDLPYYKYQQFLYAAVLLESLYIALCIYFAKKTPKPSKEN